MMNDKSHIPCGRNILGALQQDVRHCLMNVLRGHNNTYIVCTYNKKNSCVVRIINRSDFTMGCDYSLAYFYSVPTIFHNRPIKIHRMKHYSIGIHRDSFLNCILFLLPLFSPIYIFELVLQIFPEIKDTRLLLVCKKFGIIKCLPSISTNLISHAKKINEIFNGRPTCVHSCEENDTFTFSIRTSDMINSMKIFCHVWEVIIQYMSKIRTMLL